MNEHRSFFDKLEIMCIKMGIKIRKFWRRSGKRFLIQLLGSAVMLGLAAGLGICLAFAQTEASPEVYAKEYFRYYMTRNWEALFHMTDLQESTYINPDTLGKMFTAQVPNGTEEYKFVDKGEQGIYHIIDVVYTEIGSEEEETLTIRLQKTGEKQFLVLPKWEINLSDDIIKNCKIHLPADVNIVFDGVDLADCDSEDMLETGIRTYKLGPILAGTHKVELTAIESNPITEIFELTSNGAEYTVEETTYPLTDTAKKTYSNQTIDMIVAMYTGALTNVGCEDVKADFVTEEEKAGVEAVYQNLLAEINQENGALLQTMSFDTYTTEIAEYTYNKSLSMKFMFDTTFTAKGERNIVSVRETYEGQSYGEALVKFVCRDGAWVPTAIEMNCFDYSEKEEVQE